MIDVETLQALKQHLKIDFSDDDEQLAWLYTSATSYLRSAGVERTEQNGELYQLCAFSLVGRWYDNESASGGASEGLRNAINQLKLVGVANCGVGL